ncbi:MAG: acyl-CoA dehydrogenase family protein [Candidatus Schekmanbacteria bacterium]|nr:acyl-CoA dehydrogenase family protein [Candidatus Schekmanbacteria bacterium]
MTEHRFLVHLFAAEGAALRAAAPPPAAPHERWKVLAEAPRSWPSTAELAVVGGMLADGVGWAFAAGYQAALPAAQMVALCVTEPSGGHPRSIPTSLRPDGDGYRLDGQKRFNTFGQCAECLLVAASIGQDEAGRNRLTLVRIPARLAGVILDAMPDLSFVPEIPHAELTLDDVPEPASAVLSGDGYEQYIKSFRTTEDIHVNAGLLGYLWRMAQRYRWVHSTREGILALIMEVGALSRVEPLAGFSSLRRRLLAAMDGLWSVAPSPVRQRWQRDIALLSVAERAHQLRSEAAWRRLKRGADGEP